MVLWSFQLEVTLFQFPISAHKIVVAGLSQFLKNLLLEETNEIQVKLILPNFRAEVIESLLKLIYTGETSISESLVDEFCNICTELCCDSILDIDEFIKQHKNNVEQEPAEIPFKNEDFIYEDQGEDINDLIEIDDAVYQSESEELCDQNSLNFIIEERMDENESEYFLEAENDQENDMEPFVIVNEENSTKPQAKAPKLRFRKADLGSLPDQQYENQLLLACESIVKNGMSYLKASEQFGIARSVIHRHVKKLKEESFPNVDEKEQSTSTSWWDALSPSLKSNPSSALYKSMKRNDPEFIDKVQKAVHDVIHNQSSYWRAQKTYGITRSVIHRHVQKAKAAAATKAEQLRLKKYEKVSNWKSSEESTLVPITLLQEEHESFKKRLQNAINACRNDGMRLEDASTAFVVSIESLQRNL